MTNGDKIRSMTDEELQKWLCYRCQPKKREEMQNAAD